MSKRGQTSGGGIRGGPVLVILDETVAVVDIASAHTTES